MMVSASPSLIARSSLEEMLDSLRRRDEGEKPKELPPALPARPTSQGTAAVSAPVFAQQLQGRRRRGVARVFV
ncbi:hypothetical protein GBA52_013933 [Prunus armeniaca]|nr:hypothetical protein GBA52_013933 [Prunus armeniaca]